MISSTFIHTFRQFKDMVWNMLPKRVARYLRRGRNYAEPFGQASRVSTPKGAGGGGGGGGTRDACGGRRGHMQCPLGRRTTQEGRRGRGQGAGRHLRGLTSQSHSKAGCRVFLCC